LPQSTTLGIGPAGNGEQSMHSPIRRTIRILYEACFPYRTVTGDKRGNDILSAIQIGECDLRIAGRTASADRRVRMTLSATVAVECGTETGTSFSRDGPAHGVNFHEVNHCIVEKRLKIGTEPGQSSTGSWSSTTRPGIVLGRNCAWN
jgi:hypothetical protein